MTHASPAADPTVAAPLWAAVLAVLVGSVLAGCTDEAPAETRETIPLSVPTPEPALPADTLARTRLVTAPADQPVVRDGDDWTLPGWAEPAADSGFFSEEATPADAVHVRSVDVSWRQVAPAPDAPLDLTSSGSAQGLTFEPLEQQLAEPGPYWVRLFASGEDWAPEWVVEQCGVGPVATDYDGQQHLPIWDACVWEALRATWRQLLVDQGILADPDFRFAYVPGGFTWVEYDYDVISEAVRKGFLDRETYLEWYPRMLADLAEIGGDQVGRLVFTGEDYPFGPFGADDDLLTADAVRAGMGVRTGITELSNFHLSEAPAYGSRIDADGHLVVDDEGPPHDGGRVVATENECYDDCGYAADDFGYAVTMSNLKALQLRMNWIYVVPGPSGLDLLPEHWDWVRRSIGQRPATSADAWAALRDAEDRYWRWEDGPFGPGGREWRDRPYVRNYERWLVQRDVGPRAVARRSTADVHRGELEADNGVAYEGLRTDLARGRDSLAFDLDERFLDPGRSHDVLVKVTFLDRGRGSFTVRHAGGSSPPVRVEDSGDWRTATIRLPALTPDDSMPGSTDLWVTASGADLHVRFVRVVRLTPP